MESMQQNLDQFQKAIEEAADYNPGMTMQTFETIVILLLCVIAGCLVVITICLVKKGYLHNNAHEGQQNSDFYEEAPIRNKPSRADILTELKEFLDCGQITMEEFQELKQKVLHDDD